MQTDYFMNVAQNRPGQRARLFRPFGQNRIDISRVGGEPFHFGADPTQLFDRQIGKKRDVGSWNRLSIQAVSPRRSDARSSPMAA